MATKNPSWQADRIRAAALSRREWPRGPLFMQKEERHCCRCCRSCAAQARHAWTCPKSPPHSSPPWGRASKRFLEPRSTSVAKSLGNVLVHQPRAPVLVRPRDEDVLPAPPDLLPELRKAIEELFWHFCLRIDAACHHPRFHWWRRERPAGSECRHCQVSVPGRRGLPDHWCRLQRCPVGMGRLPRSLQPPLLRRPRLQKRALGLRLCAAVQPCGPQERASGLRQQLTVPRGGLSGSSGCWQGLTNTTWPKGLEGAAEDWVKVPAADPDVPVQAALAGKSTPRHRFECGARGRSR
mmetsp:Transcript_72835/g.163084  ORF Transcript_72835/g.163084 Transcript_72835/m.163084 type:complete len:295 (+) Transcript_72835:116-1000(+)